MSPVTRCSGCKALLEGDDYWLRAAGDRRPFCLFCSESMVDGDMLEERAQARAERRMLERMLKLGVLKPWESVED